MGSLFPYITGFIAMSCYATLPVLAKKMQLSLPPFAFIAVTMFFLTVFAIAGSFAFEKDFKFLEISKLNLVFLAAFAFVNFVGFAIYLYTISKIPVAEYQLIYVLSPLVVGFLAVFFLQEPFHWRYVVGIIFAMIGLVIALNPFEKT